MCNKIIPVIVGVLELGYPSIPNLCTGSRSTPRQGLPGDRQGPLWFLWSHSRTKYSSQGDKAPARGACREGHSRHKTPAGGACREGQPRHLKELAATRHVSRRGPVSGKPPDATRQRPRQGVCCGKLPLRTHAPAHPPTCRSGTIPGVRGGRLCSQRYAVASGADKIAIVANGGVPDGPFFALFGDADGHLMPLSPAVRVRYDTLYR